MRLRQFTGSPEPAQGCAVSVKTEGALLPPSIGRHGFFRRGEALRSSPQPIRRGIKRPRRLGIKRERIEIETRRPRLSPFPATFVLSFFHRRRRHQLRRLWLSVFVFLVRVYLVRLQKQTDC
jgi:hypothetical protein